ncbi:DUF1540 domain-containing protein [Massilia sp. UMI-21]|nr:DUF1540 domain-containing protein [Massilia sp. UMI-21]
MDMPVVGACSVAECAYNTDNGCHARAITVGDGVHPGCDTFLVATPHTRDTGRHAGVGACKVSSCQHNDDYECTAEQIAVGHAGHGACCLTYQQRLLPNSPVHPGQHPG